MIAVLKGKTMPAIKDFCLTNWTSESSFHRNPETTDLLIEELSSTPVDKKPLGITERMLARERSSRPTAAEIASFLITSRTEEEYETQYCGLCCLHEYDSDSQDDLCDEESPTTPYFDSQQRLVGPLTLSVSSSSDQEGDPTLRATDMGIIRHDSLNTEAATSSGETTAVDQHPGATSAVRNATEELNVRTISPQEYQTSTIGYLPTTSSTLPPPGVFGVPVGESISYAYSKIVLRGQSGNPYLHGKVPIVVAKCAERLKESDVMWERIIY